MIKLEEQLNAITNQGFCIDEAGRNDLTIAFLSLRSALKAWFATYSDISRGIRWIEPDPEIAKITGEQDLRMQQMRIHTSSGYLELYVESIVHFHHFIELILKDILRQENELMAVDASRRPVLMHKLLKGEEISPEDYENLFSIEFRDASIRVTELLKAERLDKAKYGFILEKKHYWIN